jgi:hypothetical protein
VECEEGCFDSFGCSDARSRASFPGYLIPYFFLAERVYKSCERRKLSCRRQRSSGVVARLLAKRYFSSSLRPRTRWIFASTRATFFPWCEITAPRGIVEVESR